MTTPTITSNTATQLVIGWTALTSTTLSSGNSALTGYQVQYTQSGGSTWTTLTTTAMGVASFTQTIPSNIMAYNTAYVVRIGATNACGYAKFPSSNLTFTTTGVAPTVAPTLSLTALNGTIIQVSWTAIATDSNSTGGFPTTAYTLTWGPSGGAQTQLTSANVLTFSQTSGWAWNTAYTYQVMAVNSAGTGVASANLTLTTPTVPNAMGTPSLTSISCTSLVFSWTALSTLAAQGNAQVTSYNLQYKSTGSWTSVATGSSALTYTMAITPLSWDTSYSFQLNAQNQAGQGAWSSSLTVLTPTVPVAMAAPSISYSQVLPTSINITWTALSGATNTGNCTVSGYLLEYSSSPFTTWTALTSSTYFNTYYTQTSGFSAGTLYQYKVRAYNSAGGGTYSSTFEVMTDSVPSAVAKPTYLTTDVHPQNITASWVALSTQSSMGNDTVTYYALRWLDTTQNPNVWTTLNTDVSTLVTTYTHVYPYGIFPSGSTQTYSVLAMNGVGFGPASPNLTVTCDTPPVGTVTLSSSVIHPTNLTISWTSLSSASATGGDAVSYYQLNWYDSSQNVWTVLNPDETTLINTFVHVYDAGVFPSGSVQKYTVTSMNGVGMGATSTNFSVTCDTPPITIVTLSRGAVHPSNITISWTTITSDVSTGGDPVSYYQLSWLDTTQTPSVWTVVNTDQTTLVTSLVHVYPYGIFPSGSIQTYSVSAMNGVGFGPNSNNFTVVCDTEPTGMTSLTVGDVHPTNITVTWSALTSSNLNGGDLPIFYSIEWSPDLGLTWNVLNQFSDGLVLSYMHSPGYLFTSATVQQYRVRAQNGVGMGDSNSYSSVLSVTADTPPTGMTVPVLVIQHPYNITVSWTNLTSALNGGDYPSFYLLQWWDVNAGQWDSLTDPVLNGLVFNYTHVVTSIFDPTTQQQYRLLAQNGVGWGSAYSPILYVTTCTVPSAMTTLVEGAVHPWNITLSWTALTTMSLNGMDVPYYYQVEWYDPNATTWTILSDPSSGLFFSYTHIKTDYIFPSGSNQMYRVIPENQVGLGTTYSYLNITANQVPQAMSTPTLVVVYATNVTIQWTAVTSQAQTGGDSVIFYSVQWDQGLGPQDPNWVTLNSPSEGLYTVYNHINNAIFTPNIDIYYRVQPLNGVGYGPYSSSLMVLTNTYPIAMPVPTLWSVTPYQVALNWTNIILDSETGRNSIIYYKVMFSPDNQNDFVEVSNPANGEQVSFVHTVQTMFAQNTNVYYQICPENSVGYGACSPILTVLIPTTPLFMYPPSTTYDNTNPNWIYLTWQPITLDDQTGRNPATFYDLQWDSGTNQVTWTSLIDPSLGMLNAFNHTSVTVFPSNETIYYRLRAANTVGLGAFSTVYSVLCDEYPTFMNQPVVDTSNIFPTWIYLTWSAMTDPTEIGRDNIIYYGLEWDQGNNTWINLTNPSIGVTTVFNQTSSTVYPNNTIFSYRAYAENGVGSGAYSTVLQVTTDNTPTVMNDPVCTEVDYDAIYFTWTPVTDIVGTGNSPIIYYQVNFWNLPCYSSTDFTACSYADPTQGVWQELTSLAVQGANTSYVHTISPYFYPGVTFTYQFCAMNGVGLGACSDQIQVNTDNVPNQMDPPYNTSLEFNQIVITWNVVTDPTVNGGTPVTFYRLQWDNYTYFNPLYYPYNLPSIPWVNLTDVPQEATQTTLSYTHISNPQFVGDWPIQYRIQMWNILGEGPFSNNLQVMSLNYPNKMTSPTITTADITAFWIYATWTEMDPTLDGGSAINYYSLEWDAGQSTLDPSVSWYELTDPTNLVIQTSFNQTNTTALGNNTVFRYRLRAKNGVGYGNYSDFISITSVRSPLQMTAPTNGTVTYNSIVLNWVLLTGDTNIGSSPMTGYVIMYNDNSGSGWQTVTTLGPTITTYTHTLSTPFPANVNRTNYFVYYQVAGINAVGTGILSNSLPVATDTFPNQMAQVTIVGSITPILIDISWVHLTSTDPDTGRSPILGYILQWSTQSPINYINLTTTTTAGATTFSVTSGFTINTNYLIQVAAYNAVGVGIYSTPLTILTCNVPQRMNTPTSDVSTNATEIVVDWVGITATTDTGRSPVTYYQLTWDQGNGTWVELTTPGVIVYTFKLTTAANGIQNGTTYNFKVTPWNLAGMGVSSTILTVIPSSPPNIMAAVTTAVVGTNVQITWVAPQTNGAAITSYQIQIETSTSTFVIDTVDCDGTQATIIAQLYCLVPMTTLMAAPYNLAKGALVAAKVMAANINGYNGTYSPLNTVGALIETVPNAVATPTRNSGSTNSVQMSVSWASISAYTTAAGGSTCVILSYDVQRDQGNYSTGGETWTDMQGLTTVDTATTAVNTTGIIGGTTYNVRVRASNKYGWGPWSTIAAIRCAAVPSAPSAPVTVNSTINILVSWTAPFNNGLNITAYKIQIYKKGTGPWSTTTSCDGTQNAVMLAMQCYIPVAIFISGTYGYIYGDIPSINVQAYNLEGWSAATQNSGGASIQTVPLAPTATVGIVLTQTDDTKMTFTWSTMTGVANWGGYFATAYEIWWTDSVNSFPFELLYNDTQPFQLTFQQVNSTSNPSVGNTVYPTHPIVAGTRYQIKYRAVNIFGAGPFSPVVLYYASTYPDQLAPVVTSLYNQTVTFQWAASPNIHGQAVTAYSITFQNSLGAFVTNTALCNGALSTVVTQMKCTAIMSAITSALNLNIDTLIVAQVSAYNVMGFSTPSPSNTVGVTAKKLPQTAPSNLARGAATGKTVVQINWTGITADSDTGGQPVDYIIYYDKASSGVSWYTLTASTQNLTTYTDSVDFTVGKAYQFKIAAWNDFGTGPTSQIFTIYTAIAPSGLADPTTTLNLNSYVQEDDTVVIAWVPPTDTGGLAVSYNVEVLQQNGVWTFVNQATQCAEQATVTNYNLPQVTAAQSALQCTMLVSTLTSSYGLLVGSTVTARITAYQIVGSTITTITGAGTAVIPNPPCFRTTYPRLIGGSVSPTSITAMDIDTLGNIVLGGNTQDSGLIGATASNQSVPIVTYIAKGDFYAWGKYIQTTDTVNPTMYQTVLDITFRYDGLQIAISLDASGYGQAYTIVILNQNGTLWGSFRESTATIKGKVNITGLMFDQSNYITAALDLSQNGSPLVKYAGIVRFSVANPAAASITPQFYILGGSAGKNSQSYVLQRIHQDTTSVFASAYLQDLNANRRAMLAKVSLSNGAISKYFFYQTTPLGADFNTDTSIAVIKKMSIWEDTLTTNQVISACIETNDGYRTFFGQFIFSTSLTFTVLQPNNVYIWQCLQIFQRTVSSNLAYTLINDRSEALPSGYALYYGLIDYANKKISTIPVVNGDGNNNYYGAYFVHMTRFYYWGDTINQITQSTYPFTTRVGFISIFDQQETSYSCLSSSQSYTFATASNITLNPIVSANMNWVTSGMGSGSTGPVFATNSGKTFKPLTLTGGIFNMNMKAPLMNNIWCPIVSSPAPVQISPPVVPKQWLNFNPEASTFPIQTFNITPFTLSQTCPDSVQYYSTFSSDTLSQLNPIIYFDQIDYPDQYWFNITNLNNVGMFYITLQSTIGNNQTAAVQFTVQVQSPCINMTVVVPPLASLPTYDISALVPLQVPLNWQVVSPPNSCGSIYFIFKLLNATAGGVVDTTIFSIVNTTSGIQQLQVSTSSIPAAKLWTDIMVKGYLQGDLVFTQIYTVNITNRCAVTSITPVPIANQVYYTGRSPLWFIFTWSETVGTCGPITYSANQYLSATPTSNNTLNSIVFQYPQVANTNNTLSIYTWDDTQVGTYQIRVWASLGVGGFQQASTTFTLQVIQDPCEYYPYLVSYVPDQTLWINQTGQITQIPPFTMNDTNWVCNFTYQITDQSSNPLDSSFIVANTANQGQGTNITLATTNPAKVSLSPQIVKVTGSPNRQNTTSEWFTFRVYVSYLILNDCIPGQYFDNPSQTCMNCQAPCLECISSATTCTWCAVGYTYIEPTNNCLLSSSVVNCPVGTMRDPVLGFCRACSSFCQTCSNPTTCMQCLNGYYLVNGQCYLANYCPPGSLWLDTIGCQSCPSNCNSCPNTNICTQCMQNYFLDTTTWQCGLTCPAGYYADAASRVCMVCSPACAQCVGNNYTCTQCQDIGTTQYYLAQSTCVTRCPYLNFYQNEANRSCDPCNSQCKICVNAIDDCIVCNTGSVISGRTCLNHCPLGSYITIIGTCFACDPACSVCYGSQNSQCTQCVTTPVPQYLTQTTCDSRCYDPLWADPTTNTCRNCQYYCSSCTSATNCQKCNAGYISIPQNCQGEYFFYANSSQTNVSVPFNTQLVPSNYDPTAGAVEFWFKADEIMSMALEVVLGLYPYKIRKSSGVAKIQLSWSTINYCDTVNLQSNQWYHFAFSMDEANGGSLACYLTGVPVNLGVQPVSAITNQIIAFQEITFGGTAQPKNGETLFNGYIKEFRWWSQTRSQFEVLNFMNVALTMIWDISPPNSLLAYWKLDEPLTATKYSDYASNGTVLFDPTTINTTLQGIQQMREIYLKICPEGSYVFYNDTAGYYSCSPCDPSCRDCNGNSSQNCTACNSPFKLIQNLQTCIITTSCPPQYWMDSNQNCWPCHPYCSVCSGSSQFQCSSCNQGFFKAYKTAGCVNVCPQGLYGNYLTQSCSANPIVTSIYPADGSIFEYGAFIDLTATFEVLNQEPSYTYSYGWIISKLGDSMDLSSDAIKFYSDYNILHVHLDNNILQPNNYYNITFYVAGENSVYNGMLGVMWNVIYIGIPPTGGLCSISPPDGLATISEFLISSTLWQDPDGIQEFLFFYSFDNGATFIPIDQSSNTESSLNYTFGAIYQPVNGLIKCQVMNLKGFVTYQTTTFQLSKFASSNSHDDLQALSLSNVANEAQCLGAAYQLSSIATDLGSLSPPDQSIFNPSVTPSTCNQQMCNYNGDCMFISFSSKYYCQCYGNWTGINCTFANSTDLKVLQNLTLQNAKLYTQLSSGIYDDAFLQIASSQVDLMTDDLFDNIHDIVYQKILNIQNAYSVNLTEAQNAMEILSNMAEYLQYDAIQNNQTGSWNESFNKRRLQSVQDQSAIWLNNLNRTMTMVNLLKNATIYQLDFLTTTIQIATRMISYTQALTTQAEILTMPAISGQPTSSIPYMKISPNNFQNISFDLGTQFIAEAIEYTINPYQAGNDDRVANNVFEFSIYNQNQTVTDNIITKVDVQNLTNPFEFAFPASDNQNLSAFFQLYNSYSPYKYSDTLKRAEMMTKSGLACIYWDDTQGAWSTDGCVMSSIDTTHVKCECNHLSSFSTTFTTPKLSIDVPLLQNQTVAASAEVLQATTVGDLVVWPLDEYFMNLLAIWQHNQPTFVDFLFNPGFIVVVLFWVMYFSSLVYYSGRDTINRDSMTKAEIREDLAELKDDEIQNLSQVIRDLIVRDFLHQNGKYIQREARRQKAPQLSKKQLQPPHIKIYEQMSREEKKKYKQRARRKVFGVPAGLCDRAERYYEKTLKHNKKNPNVKIDFFKDTMKNNLWIGLIAKTSKIAPRHVRLALMYLYSALYITILTLIFAFDIEDLIFDNAIIQIAAIALACQIGVWVITIPVACIFRMPLELRQKIAGVRTKKINKAFRQLDGEMGWRYSIGYFICLSVYMFMSVVVLIFNIFYPHDYVMNWALFLAIIFIFDLVIWTFGIAGFQMGLVIAAGKVRCFKQVWKAVEVFRYLKNLRG